MRKFSTLPATLNALCIGSLLESMGVASDAPSGCTSDVVACGMSQVNGYCVGEFSTSDVVAAQVGASHIVLSFIYCITPRESQCSLQVLYHMLGVSRVACLQVQCIVAMATLDMEVSTSFCDTLYIGSLHKSMSVITGAPSVHLCVRYVRRCSFR